MNLQKKEIILLYLYKITDNYFSHIIYKYFDLLQDKERWWQR